MVVYTKSLVDMAQQVAFPTARAAYSIGARRVSLAVVVSASYFFDQEFDQKSV